MNKGISVIIPNYNGRNLLQQILPPLFVALNNSMLPYEVIVSDDCSTDDSLSFLHTAYPSVLRIANPVNRGFSPAINAGIFRAQYDYVLLLNSDVKLSEHYFASLLRYFDKPDTFGVMGRIIGWEDDVIQDGGKYPSFHGAKIKTTGNYFPVAPSHGDWLYSMYLSGANALVSREKLVQLGGFDELFAPFYVEDYELSLRAWRLGWKCYYDHFAYCRHKVSVSIKSKNKKGFVNAVYYRNKMFLHAMHLQGMKLFGWYLQLIPETLIRFFTLRFYYFRALKMFFSGKNKMKLSKEKFAALARQTHVLLSVEQVMHKINTSLQQKNIRKF
jgi:GT2 family glycosyltransferase